MGLREHRSFFGSIKSHFTNEASGRYLARILREVMLSEPKLIEEILPGILGGSPGDAEASGWEIKAERAFSVSSSKTAKPKKRVADLELRRGNWGERSVLVEFKVEDQNKASPAQLEDYYAYFQSLPLKGRSATPVFYYLTKYALDENEQAIMDRKDWNARHVRYSEIWSNLSRIASSGRAGGKRSVSGLAALLVDYFEEEGMSGYRPFQKNETSKQHIDVMMRQLLPYPVGMSDSGERTVKRTVNRVMATPEIIGKLLSNINVMWGWLYDANEKLLSSRLTTGIKIYPKLDKKNLENCLKNDSDGSDLQLGHSESDLKIYAGGYFGVHCYANFKETILKKRPWMELDIFVNYPIGNQPYFGIEIQATICMGDVSLSSGDVFDIYKCEDDVRELLNSLFEKLQQEAGQSDVPDELKKLIKKLKLPRK